MGKRKRTLSPKENVNDPHLSSIFRLKPGLDGKKLDGTANDINCSPGRTEISDRSVGLLPPDVDVSADDRPTPQLRISARVQNKQKREESIFDHQFGLTGASRKVDGSSQDEDEEEDKGKALDPEGALKDSKEDVKKRRRPWELWSLEDKKTFFEALNECGKDFGAIQKFLRTKLRKKGIPTLMIKNKDQVRHFYYRTWHKISKYIEFSDDVKKSTQELYTLINYGELRRKIGGTLDEKRGQKLQELIQKGSTSVRIKGKTIRVRTPICRALKKLNEFLGDREPSGVRVPVIINVEIVPRNICSWNYVQSLSHNPRVRISCSMHKTLSSIVDHLQTKWRSTKHKICDNLLSSATFPIEVPENFPKHIWLRPPEHTNFNTFDIKLDTQVKSYAVSLLSHSLLLQKRAEIDHAAVKGKSKSSRRKKCSTSSSSEKDKPEGERKDERKEDLKEEKEEPPGELSQEDTEGSDIEIEEEIIDKQPPPTQTCSPTIASSDKDEEVVILSCFPSKHKLSRGNEIPSKLLPISIQLDTIPEEEQDPPLSYQEEVLNAVKNIKEEVTDSMETIRQLMALENVANSQEIEEDADVICVGENTRLSAHIRDQQKQTDVQEIPSEASTVQELDEQVKSPTEFQDNPDGNLSGNSTFSIAQCIERAKNGWTAKTCGMVTVGELFLMFGKKEKIILEYEFEDGETEETTPAVAITGNVTSSEPESPDAVPPEVAQLKSTDQSSTLPLKAGSDSFVASTILASEEGTSRIPCSTSLAEGLQNSSLFTGSLQIPTSFAGPSKGQGAGGFHNLTSHSVGIQVQDSLDNPATTSAGLQDSISIAGGSQTSASTTGALPNTSDEEKSKAAEDISSMMAKLLYMIKIISSKGSSEPCSCGRGSMAKGFAIGHMRSPSNARTLNGFLKSPGNTKSPRGGPVSTRSPRTNTMNATSPGDSGTSSKSEKTKPLSAKRLIAEASSDKATTSEAAVSDAASATKAKLLDNQGDRFTGMGVMPLENKSGGEFRVPIAPAPRNHGCQAPNQSFNAQISKLLPRYSRPSRRSSWKNMVVQRQLPLLPRLPNTPQTFVAQKIGNFQELTVASASSPISFPLSVTLGTTQPAADLKLHSVDSNGPPHILPSTSQIFIQQPLAIPIISESLPKETKFIKELTNESCNNISVNVSGHQLLTVKMPSFSPAYPAATSSVTTASSVTSVTQTTSSSSFCIVSSDSLTNSTSCALPSNKCDAVSSAKMFLSNDKLDLSNIISQTFINSDIPYLNTPPGTPACSSTNHFNDLLNIPSTSAAEYGGTFLQTTNSSLIPIDEISLPSLSTPVKSSTGSGSISPPCTFSESSLLNTPKHLTVDRILNTSLSPIKLNLSAFLSSNSRSPEKSLENFLSNHPSEELIPQISIPEMPGCSDSLPILDISIGGTVSLQEPKSHMEMTVPNDLNIESPAVPATAVNLSAVPSSIQSLSTVPSSSVSAEVGLSIPSSVNVNLSMVTPTIGLTSVPAPVQPTVPTIGGSCETPLATIANNIDPVSTIFSSHMSPTSADIDQLTISSHSGGILSNLPLSPESNTGISLSVTFVATPTTNSDTFCRKLSVSEESLLPGFQDSSDKMLDFTLANSNSNSSFSSLLAAVGNQSCLESIMDNSLLQTPPRPLLSGSVLCGTKSNLCFEGEGFENLSAVPLSPPSSPSRLLRQAETQWLQNEASEFSLSHLLDNLESPLKGSGQPSTPTPHCSNQSLISSLGAVSDNSVDFTAAFARWKNQTKDKRE